MNALLTTPLLLSLVLLQASPARAQSDAKAPPPQPLKTIIPRLDSTIRLDGKLGEKAWTKAARLEPFRLNASSAKSRVRTQIRAFYDSKALYLGWTCEDPDIQATFIQRDSKFWEEEVCELFITPDDLTIYYELQWNPLSGVFDAIIHNTLAADGLSRDFKGDWSYTARGMQHAVRVIGTTGKPGDRDTSWTIEVRIPFSDLGRSTPLPGDTWRANFYRFSRDAGHPVEALSWSPTHTPSFHQPSRFGFIQFK